ncbi:MAG: extracellular solute-binding protein [Pseudomonadota bacterium]|nr:extracellular solute-binding protein [Pseudomonadota bacterium]
MPQKLTRRSTLAVGAAAAALPLVHIRTGHAAGKVSIAFWDHWVPAGNDIMRKQCEAFAKTNNVAVQPDFITSNGFKNLLTIAAEAQSKSGHDVQQFPTWEVHNHADQLEPVDDVMQRLTSKYGTTNKVAEYLARIKQHWLAVPTSTGTQNKPACARISVFKNAVGIDVTKMYPVTDQASAEAANWNWDTFLKAAEACQKANMTFGIGTGTTPDSVDFAGALFSSFGADLVDKEGNITVNSDPVKQALEYAQKLVKFLPQDSVSYDDASNNRALISGKSALIFNPPSAWAVAKRDAPQVAADSWTFSVPKGPKGRFVPRNAFFWGVWNFSPNKTAAKELIEYLSQREQVQERCNVVDGYDLPPFASMLDFPIWKTVGPPTGTVFNYPIRKIHDAEPNITGMSASPEIAVQMYNRGTAPTMLAKLQSGQSIPQVISWAKDELEGYLR